MNGVNPHLEKYANLWLGSDDSNYNRGSIFVPLCGKTVDLVWLSKIANVVGIDIVREAAEQFAIEHPELSMIEYQGDEMSDICDGDLQNLKSATECTLSKQSFFVGENLTFLIGNLFDFMTLSNKEMSRCLNRSTKIEQSSQNNSFFDAIYDRASMIAIEPSLRQDYVNLLGSMLQPGGSILLITIEKREVIRDETKISGPPFSIDESLVRLFYEGLDWVKSVTLLETQNQIITDADKEKWEARGVMEAYELVFLIRKKGDVSQ